MEHECFNLVGHNIDPAQPTWSLCIKRSCCNSSPQLEGTHSLILLADHRFLSLAQANAISAFLLPLLCSISSFITRLPLQHPNDVHGPSSRNRCAGPRVTTIGCICRSLPIGGRRNFRSHARAKRFFLYLQHGLGRCLREEIMLYNHARQHRGARRRDS